MLTWSLAFLVLSLLTALMAFRDVEGASARFARILFVVFLMLAILLMFL